MAEYNINNKKIELDADKTYLDFYRANGQGNLVEINLEGMLGAIQSGELLVDDDLRKHMQYLQRWEIDAPRKRALRKMKLSGMHVLTSDELFENEDGEKIIDNLENTGIFAAYFLNEVYGENSKK